MLSHLVIWVKKPLVIWMKVMSWVSKIRGQAMVEMWDEIDEI
jgi:hypothetical protein